MNEKNDYIIKTLLVGDSCVGKSSIVTRFVDNFFQSTHMCTIGVDYKTINIDWLDNNVKFLIWDTAGQERFRSITKMYYKGSNCVIIVFDLSNVNSFNNIITWLEQIDDIIPPNTIKILVGNKLDNSDETNKCIEYSDALEFCNKYKIQHYYETSAKNNLNIDELFFTIAEEFIKYSNEHPNSNNNSNGNLIKLKNNNLTNSTNLTNSINSKNLANLTNSKNFNCCY